MQNHARRKSPQSTFHIKATFHTFSFASLRLKSVVSMSSLSAIAKESFVSDEAIKEYICNCLVLLDLMRYRA